MSALSICRVTVIFNMCVISLPSSCDQVSTELAMVDRTNAAMESFARCNFHPDCEAAINQQIK